MKLNYSVFTWMPSLVALAESLGSTHLSPYLATLDHDANMAVNSQLASRSSSITELRNRAEESEEC